MGLLSGRTILVTGILTDRSIAFHVARVAQLEGADVIATGYRPSLLRRVAGRLPRPVPVIELDVTDTGHVASLEGAVREHADRLDGVLHSIAFAPAEALGGNFLRTGPRDAATTFEISVYSLQAVTTALLPLLRPGAGVVGLDFDPSRTWEGYDWMGVAKAGLESCARYLARYLGPRGIRVNLVSAGPLRTPSGRSRHFGPADPDRFEADWDARAPLGWRADDAGPVAMACVALFSDWFPATTGEIVHVDGGAHAIGDLAAQADPAPTSAGSSAYEIGR